MTNKIPVTVLTGFLGSGKTTLLSHILTNKSHGYKIAVIENEFASPIGVQNEMHHHDHEADSPLVNAAYVAEIVETSNGCLCCSGKGEFLQLLFALIKNKDKFDYLIIETTGMADPSFASVFLQNSVLKEHYILDGIVTLVDAKHASQHLNKKLSPEALKEQEEDNVQIVNETVEQIAFADRIIINKTDLLESNKRKQILGELESHIKQINSEATISYTQFSKVDLKEILNIRSFDVDRILKQDPGFLNIRPYRKHDSSVGSLTLTGDDPLDLSTFKQWFQTFLKENGEHIYRTKGVLVIKGQEKRYVFHGVHDTFDIRPHTKWYPEEPRINRIVFIGRDLDERSITLSFNQANQSHLSKPQRKDPNAPSMGKMVFMLCLIAGIVYPDQSWAIVSSPIFLSIVLIAAILYKFSKKYMKNQKQQQQQQQQNKEE